MPFIISNPWGLLALLGIPAILLIHFLQRRAQVLPCSTLFLLQQTQKESVSGRKFDKLIHSVPLWMQLLIVLLATLLIIQPRYINRQSTQRIAIVLDGSASMSVFRENAIAKVIEQIPLIQGNATNLELWLLDSDISKKRVYHGDSLDELKKALDTWQPSSGTNNPHHSLRVARSLAGTDGSLLYITDTPTQSIPYNTSVHAIGQKQNNVGFTGITFDSSLGDLIWKASIRNYASVPTSRTWVLTTDQGEQTSPRQIDLAPGELKVISGPFPEKRDRIQLTLSGDVFSYDNVLPIITPAPKTLEVFTQCSAELGPFSNRLSTYFERLNSATESEQADLLILSKPAEIKKFGRQPAIVFLESTETSPKYQSETIVAADHPLTHGLNWASLLISSEKRFAKSRWDTPLIWAGDEAIISLREVPMGLNESRKQLIFNFNILASNADQQESIALLLFRFINSQRDNKKSLFREITELNQVLNLNVNKQGRATTLEEINLNGEILSSTEHDPKQQLHAISKVGFYSIKQSDQYLLHASNYYADTREADLSKCASGVLESPNKNSAVDLYTNEDFLWRLWVLLTLCALLTAWFFTKQPQTKP